MTRALFHLPCGGSRHGHATEGQSLMQAAKTGGVPGIDADCGGAMVCGTCHVIVGPDWFAQLPPACEMESIILEGVPDPHPQARLSCQILMNPSLTGLEVIVPRSQR